MWCRVRDQPRRSAAEEGVVAGLDGECGGDVLQQRRVGKGDGGGKVDGGADADGGEEVRELQELRGGVVGESIGAGGDCGGRELGEEGRDGGEVDLLLL